MLPQTLPNMNYKWKNNFNEEQKTILDKTLRSFLTLLGYD